jgi:hypothetical protein
MYFIYLLLTVIRLMPGGNVYKDRTFNKETTPTSHENSTIHRTNFHRTSPRTLQNSKIQKMQKKSENRRKQDEYAARKRTQAVKPIARRYIV